MTVSVHDVARELRRRQPGLPSVKIQKLCYYAQGWFLAWKGEPLFTERVEAWEMGPVVADLWRTEKKRWESPPEQQLDAEMHVVIDFVINRYGRLSGRELITLTHAEEPWVKAHELGPNAELTLTALRDYFVSDDEQVDLARWARALVEKEGVDALRSRVLSLREQATEDETAELEQIYTTVR